MDPSSGVELQWVIDLSLLCKELHISNSTFLLLQTKGYTVKMLEESTKAQLKNIGMPAGPILLISRWAEDVKTQAYITSTYKNLAIDIGLNDRAYALLVEHHITPQNLKTANISLMKLWGFDEETRVLIENWKLGNPAETSSKVVYISNTTIREDRITVIGFHNKIYGYHCTVKGNYNRIYGNKCIIEGDFNKIHANHCDVNGNNTIDYGFHTTVCGSNTTVYGNGVRAQNSSGNRTYAGRHISASGPNSRVVLITGSDRDTAHGSTFVGNLHVRPGDGGHTYHTIDGDVIMGDHLSGENVTVIPDATYIEASESTVRSAHQYGSVVAAKIDGNLTIPPEANVTFNGTFMSWVQNGQTSCVNDCSGITSINGIPMKEYRNVNSC